MSISGSGRGAFKSNVWPDWIRVIAVVHAERGPRRLRRVSWRPHDKVPPMVRPTGAVIGRPKRWALARKFHHEGRKVAKSFRQPVTIESLTQEVTGDFANDGL